MNDRSIGMWIVLVLVLAGAAGITFWSGISRADEAPAFMLTDTGFTDGVEGNRTTFSLSDYEGQTVVIDFMAVNCASCRYVTPRVVAPLWNEYGQRDDFSVLSIDGWAGRAGETNEDLIRWQMEEAAPWRHALDTDEVMQRYGVVGLPALMVVDGEGRIVFNEQGVASKDDVEAAVLASFEGEASSVGVLQVGVVGLAFLAGIASFFAPCSVGLIPAYMGFLLQQQQHMDRQAVVRTSLVAGGKTALGIVSLYFGLFIILLLLELAGIGMQVRERLPILTPIFAGLLILVGILMLAGFDWERLGQRLGMGKVDGRKGFFAFGVGYGLAAFGCTGPIFLPILLAGFSTSPVLGALAFLVYSIAVAAFVVIAAYLTAAGQQTRLRAILGHTKAITRVSAVLLIIAGAYLLWFDWQAYGAGLFT